MISEKTLTELQEAVSIFSIVNVGSEEEPQYELRVTLPNGDVKTIQFTNEGE